LTVHSVISDNKKQPSVSRLNILIAAAVAGVFPDIDYVMMPIDTLSFITDWHRGPTHSILMIPLWALLLGWLSSLMARQRENLALYTLVAVVGLFSHIFSDVITAWGTQIFWPLSDYRAVLATSFVIDPIMTALVSIALLASLYWKRRRFAVLGFAALVTYIAMQAVIKSQVETLAEAYAVSRGIDKALITSLPQPLAPFNWTLVISDGDSYHLARTNILLSELVDLTEETTGYFMTLMSFYRPSDQLQWQVFTHFGRRPDTVEFSTTAWQQKEFSRFRRFARMPILFDMQRTAEETCARFADIRFLLPTGDPPFVYGMCQNRDGFWHLE